MLYYKPTNTYFKNKLEAKQALGHSYLNRLIKTHSDDLVFINKASDNETERLQH